MVDIKWSGLFMLHCIITHYAQAECNTAAYDPVDSTCVMNVKLPATPFYSDQVPSHQVCANMCTENKACHGINLLQSDADQIYTCDLLSVTTKSCDDLEYEKGSVHYSKVWSGKTCVNLGTSIHPVPACPNKDACSEVWRKIYAVSSSGTVTQGTLEGLKDVLQTGVAVRVKGIMNGQEFVMDSEHFMFRPSEGPVTFFIAKELLALEIWHRAINSDGIHSFYNVSSQAALPDQQHPVTVFVQSSCKEGFTPVYDKNSVGKSEKFKAWLDAQREASTFIIQTKEDDWVETFVTSSTIYDAGINQFGAVTKLDGLMRSEPDKINRRYTPGQLATYMMLWDGTIEGKLKRLSNNRLSDVPLQRSSISWYPESCRKKVFVAKSNGDIHPSLNFESLKNNIYNGTSNRVFISIEGDGYPNDVITFEPDLIVCKPDELSCQALSGLNPEISDGILNTKSKLSLTSIKQFDYVYEINGTEFNYYEVQKTTTKKTTKSFRKITWYTSSRPYSLVYRYDGITGMMSSSLATSIASGSDLVMVFTDHNKNEVQIWRIAQAGVLHVVSMYQLYTHDVLRPGVPAPGCPEQIYNRWKLNLMGIGVKSPTLQLFTWNAMRTAQCGHGSMYDRNQFTVEIYAIT